MNSSFSKLNILILVTLFVCCSDSEDQHQLDLNTHRTLWNTQAIAHYSYDYVPTCFCAFAGVKLTIEVNADSIVSIFNHETNAAVDPVDYSSFQTIQGLFDRIQAAISAKAVSITVTYNKGKGYPEFISIDYSKQIADEEYGAAVSNFTIQ